MPDRLIDPLASLAASMPVVLATRTGAGQILQHTYGFPGSEQDLIRRGLLPAGSLPGNKARLLLALSLHAGSDRPDILRRFGDWSA